MFLIVVTVFLTIILITVLYPLIYVISSSFSSGRAVTTGKVWLLPVEPTLHGYKTAFAYPQILRGFQNSAIYTAFWHADQRGHDHSDRLPAVAA